MSVLNKSTFGLGDLAYYAFRPVVYGIDWIWGTDLKDCQVCVARRERWNDLLSVPKWLALAALTMLGVGAIWWVTR